MTTNSIDGIVERAMETHALRYGISDPVLRQDAARTIRAAINEAVGTQRGADRRNTTGITHEDFVRGSGHSLTSYGLIERGTDRRQS